MMLGIVLVIVPATVPAIVPTTEPTFATKDEARKFPPDVNFPDSNSQHDK